MIAFMNKSSVGHAQVRYWNKFTAFHSVRISGVMAITMAPCLFCLKDSMVYFYCLVKVNDLYVVKSDM